MPLLTAWDTARNAHDTYLLYERNWRNMDWRVSAVEQKPSSRGNKLTFITLYVKYGAHEESIFHRGLRVRYYQGYEASRKVNEEASSLFLVIRRGRPLR